MCAQPVEQHWFISLKGRRYGPYSYAALTEAATRGVIDSETMVWRLGWLNWHPARQVPGLIDEPAEQDAENGAPQPHATDEQRVTAEDEGEEERADQERAEQERAEQEQAEREQAEREQAEQERAEQERAEQEEALPLAAQTDAADEEIAEQMDAQQEAAERRVGQAGRREAARWRPAQRDAPVRSLAVVSELLPQREAGKGAADLDEAWRSYFEETPARVQQRRRRGSDSDDVLDAVERPVPVQPLDPEMNAGAARLAETDGEMTGEVVPDVPPHIRERLAPRPRARRARGSGRNLAIGAAAIVLLIAAGWGLFAAGLIVVVDPHPTGAVGGSSSFLPEPPAPAAPGQPASSLSQSPSQSAALEETTLPAGSVRNNLPATVAEIPAVVALKRYHPAAYERFAKRFNESAVNAPGDQLASLARSALRKSVKRLLANAPADTLLDITETYLGYMQGLQFASPESCVALSDESKGATLTANLPKDFPSLFARDMAIIARIASADESQTIAALSAEQARPYLETVFNRLRQQSVQSDLLGRAKLTPSEYLPYCTLVIAFYEFVLALPQEDRVNLLRYLYAAAADPDDGG